MSATGIITEILHKTDVLAHDFIFVGYNALAKAATPWFLIIATIVVALVGWGMIRGIVQTPMSVILEKVILLAVIAAFLRNWGLVSETMVNFFMNGPEELSRIILNAVANYDLLGEHSTTAGLQIAFEQGMLATVALFKAASITNLSPLICGVFTAAITFGLCGLAVAFLVIAKFGTAVLLVLAPVFLLFLPFATTSNLTVAWLRHLLTFALTPVLVHAALLLALSLFGFGVEAANAALKQQNMTFATVAGFLLSGIVSIPLLIHMRSLAASIGAGVALSTEGMVARYLGISAIAGVASAGARGSAKVAADYAVAKSKVGVNIAQAGLSLGIHNGVKAAQRSFKHFRNRFGDE